MHFTGHRSSVFILAGLCLVVTKAPAAVNFEKQILPVLLAKCMDCHKAAHEENGKRKEPKADLRLDAAWSIMKGSKDGPILKPGDSAKSSLYEVVTLPKDDDRFMPSKGDPLTEVETKLLKEWIDTGADFGGWKGNLDGAPAEAVAVKVAKTREHELFYKALEAGLKPAAEASLAAAKAAGAQTAPLKADSALLRVDFLTGVSKCTDEKVTALVPLKENIAQLDLGRTIITDATLKTVAQFSRLAVLDLRQTKVTDAGLEALTSLKKLQTLNLYGTGITDAGVKHLTSIKSLKQVFLWQSQVTEAGAKELTAAIPNLQVVLK